MIWESIMNTFNNSNISKEDLQDAIIDLSKDIIRKRKELKYEIEEVIKWSYKKMKKIVKEWWKDLTKMNRDDYEDFLLKNINRIFNLYNSSEKEMNKSTREYIKRKIEE